MSLEKDQTQRVAIEKLNKNLDNKTCEMNKSFKTVETKFKKKVEQLKKQNQEVTF